MEWRASDEQIKEIWERIEKEKVENEAVLKL